MNIDDPEQTLYVQTTSGPFSKRAYLGCRNHTRSALSARFAGPNSVLVKADGQWTVTFDPDEVRAVDTLPADS